LLHWKPRRNWKGKVSIWKSSICVHCCRSISKLFSIPSARRTKLSSSTRTLGLEVLRANWLLSFPKRRLNTSMDLFAASPRPIHQCRTARRSRSSSFLKLPMLFVWHASCTPTKFWCSVGRKRFPLLAGDCCKTGSSGRLTTAFDIVHRTSQHLILECALRRVTTPMQGGRISPVYSRTEVQRHK